MMGAQGFLAWTFNSHLGGEEQALFGLVDHDGTPSWKVDELARFASEFKQLSKLGFPRYTHRKWPSHIPSIPSLTQSRTAPPARRCNTLSLLIRSRCKGPLSLFRTNIDTAVINVGHADLSPYKLVIVSADYLMDPASAKALRNYVSGGGTVLMTAF